MPNINHLLTIKSEPGSIYSAISTIKGLSQWWTPATSGDAQVGGTIRFGFGPDYFKLMEVKNLQEKRSVEWACTQAVEDWVGTTLRFEITEEASNCKLHFQHNDWQNYNAMFSQCSFDWAMFLRSLKMYCETGKGLPFPDQGKY